MEKTSTDLVNGWSTTGTFGVNLIILPLFLFSIQISIENCVSNRNVFQYKCVVQKQCMSSIKIKNKFLISKETIFVFKLINQYLLLFTKKASFMPQKD